MEKTYGAFAITLEHTRSFKPEHITQFLFGSDLVNCCNTLSIQGSLVADRSSKAWLADYFGLSPDFDGCVSFCPRIKNIIADINIYLGLDECYEGLFFRFHVPITWTKWALNMCECVKNSGSLDFPAGYMAETAIARNKLPDSFMEAVSGNAMFGDMKDPMKYGLMKNCKLTKVGIADIHASLGWNFKTDEDYHFGFFIHTAAPTGTRPSATYLFEPIIGNGKHWELGLGITSSYIFWRSCEYSDRYLGVWLDGTFTHMFKTRQCRSFDFCGKPNSRYMLLEEMGTNEDDIKIAPVLEAAPDPENTIVADYQYKKNLIPAINWSTYNVDVKINFQADVVLKFGYVRENWSMDLGYNLWARTGEKFCFDCCDDCCGCNCQPEQKYAIKGDAFVYGFEDDEPPVPFAISATQSTANIHGGTNYPRQAEEIDGTNPRIDNPTDSYGQDYWTWTGGTPLYDDFGFAIINTSIQPILASRCDLNLRKSPSAITHKIFWSLNYAWKERSCQEWLPFIGIGWEVEFAQRNKCCGNFCSTGTTPSTTNGVRNKSCGTSCSSCCNDCSDCCKKAGVYQYGVWFKGGFAFD